MKPQLRIGIVAGEISGDLLGVGLMQAIKKRQPSVEFVGVGGPKMQEEGCLSLYPMETLANMGIMEVVRKLLDLLKIRRALINYFKKNPPDIYIGIDVPEFNLAIEKSLKKAGILTAHYVSPQVWAWRGYRIKGIRRSLDHILVLFPFEEKFYKENGVPVTFVGHPLADMIEEKPDKKKYRKKLGLPLDQTIVSMLPGSRGGELRRHNMLFIDTIQWLYKSRPEIQFVVPFVNEIHKQQFERQINDRGMAGIPITYSVGSSREAMAASDVVLLASGTATLEAALIKRPMVVTYKMSPVSIWLIRKLSHVKNYALPNHLAGKTIVPEFIQEDAQPEALGKALLDWLDNEDKRKELTKILEGIHRSLKQDANEKAAECVLSLVSARQPA